MAAIDPAQLEFIAAFLERSRDYLDVEHSIRLRWPQRSVTHRCGGHPPRSTCPRQKQGTKVARKGNDCSQPAA